MINLFKTIQDEKLWLAGQRLSEPKILTAYDALKKSIDMECGFQYKVK